MYVHWAIETATVCVRMRINVAHLGIRFN